MEEVGIDRRAGLSSPLQAGNSKSHLPWSLAKCHAWGPSLLEQVLLLSCELEGGARPSLPTCPSASLRPHSMDFDPRRLLRPLGGLPCSARVTLTPAGAGPQGACPKSLEHLGV